MEALQKMSDPKLTDCPACEQPRLKKQVTAAAFELKVTGWYETDFKNSGSKVSAPANNSKADSSDASASVSDAAATPAAATSD